MNRSSVQVGMISVATAILLWLVATWFEDDTRWLPPKDGVMVNANTQHKKSGSPEIVVATGLDCEQTESRLKARVESARGCSTNNDCTLFDYGYPIQCMTSISKTHITPLRLEYRNYERVCAYRVFYDCPSGDMQRIPVCRNRHCEVELVTTGPLQDATLQHLGIKDQ